MKNSTKYINYCRSNFYGMDKTDRELRLFYKGLTKKERKLIIKFIKKNQ